jgi:hypothetical protein
MLPGVLNEVPEEMRSMVADLFNPLILEEKHQVHNRLVLCYEPEHKDFFRQSAGSKEWIDTFSCTQGYKDKMGNEHPGIRKGMLSIPFGSAWKIPDVGAWLQQR